MHVFTYYSILTTHFWMFNEALHLYLAVAHVYSKHKDSLMLFLGIGWVSPAVVMAVYAAVRMYYLNDMENCCTGYSHAFYIISLVVFGSHIATFFLLLNVVGILYQKSKRFPRHNRMIAMIKATKAALVLTPLFALHYYLILKQLSRQNAVRHSYQVGSAVVVTLLGLFLAINFCFTNTDVIRSFNELFNPRKEAPVVNIAMTDMSGNHRDSQV
ncbi:corticotropin-releasing factor receptor 1-like isoform X2 [Pieris rapae]|uniref:corticotropin-releasing factor receptor 1-like isoform X2 n=1 Tax=Pieris rapae TaxID=64459 RepID=UPI001E2805D3|nr:corticotropin-releasing factor receptor 1-like isoform X2 [Pieris rapae]